MKSEFFRIAVSYPAKLYKQVSSFAGLALLFIIIQLTSCGIFTPRDSDPPLPAGRTDPLSFSAIMEGTGYQFNKLLYEDLFSENVVYSDINSGVYNKTQLIQTLQLIQRQNPNIQVEWTPGTTNKKPNDTFYLTGFQYKIFVSGDVNSVPDEEGSSDFIVVRENYDWHICLWRVSRTLQGKSFFSPP